MRASEVDSNRTVLATKGGARDDGGRGCGDNGVEKADGDEAERTLASLDGGGPRGGREGGFNVRMYSTDRPIRSLASNGYRCPMLHASVSIIPQPWL